MPAEPPDQLPPPDAPPPPDTPGAVAVSSVAVKRRAPLVPILAGVVALAVAVVAVVLLARGDDAEAGPVAAVRGYVAAFTTGDCEAAFGLIDTDRRPGEPRGEQMIDACRQAYDEDRAGMEGARLESAELVSEDGDQATVRIEVTEAGEDEPGEPENVFLVRVDGDWKIDMSGGGAAPDDAGDDAAGGDAGP